MKKISKEEAYNNLKPNKPAKIKKLNRSELDLIISAKFNPNNQFNNDMVIIKNKFYELDFLKWKQKKLERFKPKLEKICYYDKYAGREIIENILYFSTIKLIQSINYCDPEISPFCLALIISDNGTYENQELVLTVTNNIYLFHVLINKYEINPTFRKNQIIIKGKNLEKLKSIIYPFMFHKMKYKFGEYDHTLPKCIVSKTVEFDSAHFLSDYNGKCNNLHGGRYKLTVYIKGPINPDTGMVVDFTYLNEILKQEIISQFDHHCLNYVTPQLAWRSTTELICLYIWEKLIKIFPSLHKIELYETPNSKCTFKGEDFEKYNYNLDLLHLK